MKILYVTTIGLTMVFFKSFLRELLDRGHIVDIATNEKFFSVPDCYKEWGCNIFQVSWTRSPLTIGNLIALKEIRKIVSENKYDLVHCHTPIASAFTRFACKDLRSGGLKVIYTAHGFHFYKGASITNWLLYYPIEKYCAHLTDILITINKEDYAFALKKIKAKSVEYVPGVGIDIEKYKENYFNQSAKRGAIDVPCNAFLVLSVGELNKNKNHQIVIRSIAALNKKSIHYVIVGIGDQKNCLEKLAKELGVEKQIHFLGYRTDVAELYKSANVYVLPSIREGLNVSVMEAMASGLPCIISNIRGNVDLITEKMGGYLCHPYSINDFSIALLCLFGNYELCKRQGLYNSNAVVCFSHNVVSDSLYKLYMRERISINE